MDRYQQISFRIGAGGTSQAVSISTTSAQSAAVSASFAIVRSTVDCFVRSGSNPTALSDGTDLFLPANESFRVALVSGEKIAAKTASGSGTLYITPQD